MALSYFPAVKKDSFLTLSRSKVRTDLLIDQFAHLKSKCFLMSTLRFKGTLMQN